MVSRSGMGSFAAARHAMASIAEEYKEAEECNPKDYTYEINELELVEENQNDEDSYDCYLKSEEKEYLE